MVEVQYVRVTQTREIVVRVNRLEDAVAIASAEFNGTPVPMAADGKMVWGSIYNSIKQTSIHADLA